MRADTGDNQTLRGVEVVRDDLFIRPGTGPLLVLLHGLDSDPGMWDSVTQHLTDRFSIAVPTLTRPSSATQADRFDVVLRQHVDHVIEILRFLDAGPAIIVGHGSAGTTAMRVADREPSLVRGLVLESAGVSGEAITTLLHHLTEPGLAEELPMAMLPILAGASAEASGGTNERQLARFVEVWRSYDSLGDIEARVAFIDTVRSAITRCVAHTGGPDLLDLAMRVPLQLIWGENDTVVPVEQGRFTHRLLEGSRLAVIENAGRFAAVDRPISFSEIVVDFVEDALVG